MKNLKWWLSVLMVGFILSLSACAGAQALKPLDAAEVTSLRDSCEALYQKHMEAWDSRDPENFRQIYTDDVVHVDGDPANTGVYGLIDVGRVMFEVFPDWQMEAGDTYISKNQCLGTWLNWGVFGFSQDDPGIEYDWMETRENKISYWRMFYDQKFHQAIENADLVNDDFLQNYASAWSSGDPDTILKIYASDAELDDSLFGFSIAGQEAIGDYASRFLATSSEASWDILDPFSESLPSNRYKDEHPYASQGAVYAIQVEGADGNPCEIRAVVILTPNGDGLIQTQNIFYEAETLVACGWARDQ